MKTFGFCPEPIKIDAEVVRICPLREHETIVNRVLACDRIHKDWIYAPAEQIGNGNQGLACTLPYSARVFSLPKTHRIEHDTAIEKEHVEFHVWALSLFLGIRLTMIEAGYLDATPIKIGKLVDFVLLENSVTRAVELAEQFWIKNSSQRKNVKLFVAAVHCLFLGKYPQSLQFERFIYLYTAIDACFRLGTSLKRETKYIPHSDRIDWMCNQFRLKLPDWAKRPVGGDAEVTAIRNPTLHEALFMDEPLGYAIHGQGTHVNLTHEMGALVCRLLVALIGGNASYLGSGVDSMQRQGLKLG